MKSVFLRKSAALGLILLSAATAAADGIPINNGRFSGGFTTVLTLTQGQQLSLAEADEEHRSLKLSDEQKALLEAESGIAPSVVYVYDTRIGETTCTCDLFNAALQFADTMLEIPHEYLLSDAEAEEYARQTEVL